MAIALSALAICAWTGCRGTVSHEPPVHLQQNMDQQERMDPQEAADFWEDGRAMRAPVEGTMAFVATPLEAGSHSHLFEGRTAEGFAETVPKIGPNGEPMAVDMAFLKRGKERYEIYCVPCHDGTGAGKGLIVNRGLKPPPPNFHEDRLRAYPIGQFYNVIKNGYGSMGAYGAQIPVKDRWAIATYVRTLQVSRNAALEEVPADKAAANRWEIR
jgi:mono/diheme cytochrome c family protein